MTKFCSAEELRGYDGFAYIYSGGGKAETKAHFKSADKRACRRARKMAARKDVNETFAPLPEEQHRIIIVRRRPS